jgi:hypothetical protein
MLAKFMTQVSFPAVVAQDAADAGLDSVSSAPADVAASKATRRREYDALETARVDAVVIPRNSPKTLIFTGGGRASKSWGNKMKFGAYRQCEA